MQCRHLADSSGGFLTRVRYVVVTARAAVSPAPAMACRATRFPCSTRTPADRTAIRRPRHRGGHYDHRKLRPRRQRPKSTTRPKKPAGHGACSGRLMKYQPAMGATQMGGLAAGVVQPEENEDDGNRDQNQSQRAQSQWNDEHQQHSNVRMKDGTTDDDTETPADAPISGTPVALNRRPPSGGHPS